MDTGSERGPQEADAGPGSISCLGKPEETSTALRGPIAGKGAPKHPQCHLTPRDSHELLCSQGPPLAD